MTRNESARPVALITGASGGIGLELARVFARNKHDLVLVARSGGKLEAIAGQLEGKHAIKVTVHAADLRDSEAPQRLFDTLLSDGVHISVLVNNAGIGLGGEFSELDVQPQLDMIDLNVSALTHLTRLFLPQMIRRKSGRILNVASTAAFQPGPLMAVYYASKAYVLSLSQALAEELRDSGVTVTALCPGPTESDFAKSAGLENSRLFALGMIASAADVAEYGYDATMSGKRIAIPGIKNKLVAQVNRLVPRRMSARFIRKVQENR